jgi:type IV secretory pathway TraG/TraD family ATPase VirD4
MRKTIILLLILICTTVFISAQEPTSPKLKELDAQIKQKDAKYSKSTDFNEQKKLGTELAALRQQRSQELSRLQAANPTTNSEKWIKDRQNMKPEEVIGNIVGYAVFGLSFLIICGIVGLIIWLAIRIRPGEPLFSDAHGTARFSDLDELRTENILRENLETKAGDFIIGQCDQGFMILPWQRTSRHELIVGANGSGKTLSVICPNIVKSTGESLFISDVKRQKGTTNGELWELTSGHTKKACYFSPLEPAKNMLKFNWIPALRGDVVTAKLFAEAVVFSSDGAKNAGANAFFYETAKDLLAAVWLHAAETDHPTPANAYQILMLKESEFRKLLESSHAPEARLAARTYLDAPDKTSGNILTTARNSFSFMQSKELQHFTDTPTATDFSALRREEIAIYYQARSEKKTLLQPLNCLILTYIFTQLKETDGLMVKFILDEFANFGKIPDFATEITLLRDKNLPIIAAVQTLRSQIESNYGKIDTDTILGNFNNKVCFAGLDETTAEEISRSLGDYTYVQEKVSVGRNGFDKSTTTSIQEHRRRLMTADEITRMATEEILAFHISELHPFKAWKIPYQTERKTRVIEEREVREIEPPPRLQLSPMSAQDEIHIPPMREFG